jgi:hypothetical protein
MSVLFLLLRLDVARDVHLAGWVFFLWTVEWRPNRLTDKEPHRLDVIGFVTCESMVDTFWKRDEIPLLNVDTDPLVVSIADIKISGPIQNVADFYSRSEDNKYAKLRRRQGRTTLASLQDVVPSASWMCSSKKAFTFSSYPGSKSGRIEIMSA